MSSCLNTLKNVGMGMGAAATVASLAVADYLFSNGVASAKLYGEKKCSETLSQASVICNDIWSQYSRNFYGMVGLGVGAAFGAGAVNYALCRTRQANGTDGEAISLTASTSATPKRRYNTAPAVLGAGVGIVELLKNIGLGSVTKDAAKAWGNCLAQVNATASSCQGYENDTFVFSTAAYVVTGVIGLTVTGTFIWSAGYQRRGSADA